MAVDAVDHILLFETELHGCGSTVTVGRYSNLNIATMVHLNSLGLFLLPDDRSGSYLRVFSDILAISFW